MKHSGSQNRYLEQDRDQCPECASAKLQTDYQKGETSCSECGLVIMENIEDHQAEWHAFDSEKRVRTGAPITQMRPNKGLPTYIDRTNRDIHGTKIGHRSLPLFSRLRRWQNRLGVNTNRERNLAIALPELDRTTSSIGIAPPVREEAALLYRRCIKADLIRGRLIETMVSASIYAACRVRGAPRTLDEISAATGIRKKEIGRAYRLIRRELRLEIPLSEPCRYIPKIAAALNISGRAQEKAVRLLKMAGEDDLISGRAPTGVAAAAVYIASAMNGERRTQKEVADVARVTEVTVRNRYRELKKELGLKMAL